MKDAYPFAPSAANTGKHTAIGVVTEQKQSNSRCKPGRALPMLKKVHLHESSWCSKDSQKLLHGEPILGNKYVQVYWLQS